METTTEDLDFKDVPIFPKEKPPPGFKYVLVYKCKGSTLQTVSPATNPLLSDAAPADSDAKVDQIVENVRAAVTASKDAALEDTKSPVVLKENQNNEVIAEVEKSVPLLEIASLESVPKDEEKNSAPPEGSPTAVNKDVAPLSVTLIGQDLDNLKIASVEHGADPTKIDQGQQDAAPIVVKLSGQDFQHLKLVSVHDSTKQKEVEAFKNSMNQGKRPDGSVVITLSGQELSKLQIVSAEGSPALENAHQQVLPAPNAETIKKDESFEMNGEMLTSSADKAASIKSAKDFTGYKVYRVTIPTEMAAKWIMKFEDLPGIEFWADPKMLLRPKGMFVTSAADILVAPDVTESMEEAFRQARLPFEILIPDVQVFQYEQSCAFKPL